MHQKYYLKLSFAFTITTITTPLLGLVDTALMGHLTNPAYIAGVTVGVLVFNTIYWLFGFLRFSTIAFTAQAFGANEPEQLLWAFIRPFIISIGVGAFFILLQYPLIQGTFWLVNPEKEVAQYAQQYFSILIWGAPFTLANYVCTGWLMGNARLRPTFLLQVFTNILNLILTIVFVIYLHWEVRGVAWGTLIAQVLSTFVGVVLVWKYNTYPLNLISWKQVFDLQAFYKIMKVNSDLMIRTLCLLIMTNLFVATNSSFGLIIFAANAILFQLHYLIGTFIDGFASATSVLAAQAMGKKSPLLLKETIHLSWVWTCIMIVVLTIIYLLWYKPILSLFTNDQEVLTQVYHYSFWLILYPLSYGFNSVFYGFFNGIMQSAIIRMSALIALLCFLLGLWLLVPTWQSNGLWIAFLLFNMGRTVYLIYQLLKVRPDSVTNVSQ